MNLIEYISIKEGHSLVRIKSYRKGSLDEIDYYEYDEIDEPGNLVYKYKAWSTTSTSHPFNTSKGYRKMDLNDNTIEEKFNLK